MTLSWPVAIGVGCAVLVLLLWAEPPLRRLTETRREPSSWVPQVLRSTPGSLPAAQRGRTAVVAGIAVAFVCPGPLLVVVAVAALIAVGTFVVLGRLEPRSRSEAQAALVDQLPGALDLMSACVDAGLPLRIATEAVAHAVGGSWAERADRYLWHVRVGFSDAEAWRTLAEDPVVGPLARDLARAADAGTSVGPILRLHARDARTTAAAAVTARAKTVGVSTIIPVSLCYMPAFFLIGVVPAIAGLVSGLFR